MNVFDEIEYKRKILKLQQDYETGIILEEELSKNQKEELINLYNDQINNLEEEINRSNVTLKLYKDTISKKIDKIKRSTYGI